MRISISAKSTFYATPSLLQKKLTERDRCKRRVVAEKRFTIHQAPIILTIHLKRFSPLGRKIGHAIKYEEKLSLAPYMSEGQFGPTYSLYGVISHAGGGPNSGHYFAHVRAPGGGWFEMNDDAVISAGGGGGNGGAPTGLKSAYVLFYVLERGQALEAAVGMNGVSGKQFGGAYTNGNANGHANGNGQNGNGMVNGRSTKSVIGAMNGKRKSIDRETEEEKSTPNKRPFIGPVMPSQSLSQSTPPSPSSTPATSLSTSSSTDRQALALKRKIEAVKAKEAAQVSSSPTPKSQQQRQKPKKKSNALLAISQEYGDEDDEDGDVGEKVVLNGKDKGKEKEKEKESQDEERSQSPTTPSTSTSTSVPPPPVSSSPTPAPSQPRSSPIPPSSFYGTVPPASSSSKEKNKKRKSPDTNNHNDNDDERNDEPPQTPKSAAVNIKGFNSSSRSTNTPRIIGVGDKWNPIRYGRGGKKRRIGI